MKKPRDLRLVAGYLPSDEIPKGARARRLFRRSAVVIDTHPSNGDDLVLDGRLFCLVVNLVSELVVDADLNAVGVRGDGSSVRRMKLDELLAAINGTASDSDLPQEITFYSRERRALVFIVQEAWWKIGGPVPYHDSLTIAIYTSFDMSSALEDQLRKRALGEGGSFLGVVAGDDAPSKKGPIRKLFGFAMRILFG